MKDEPESRRRLVLGNHLSEHLIQRGNHRRVVTATPPRKRWLKLCPKEYTST
jgi:hypothetical protein